MSLLQNSTITSRSINANTTQIIPWNRKGIKSLKLLYEANTTMIPKTDERKTKQENCRPSFEMNIDADFLNKILASWI